MIPPAWRDVWISPRANAKLQATGSTPPGGGSTSTTPTFERAQEQAKYDKLIRFAERLPDLRAAMAEHMERDELDRERICAVAIRLINLGWFRVGSERYATESRTYGITTLTKRHVDVRGSQITFRFRGKHRVLVRTRSSTPSSPPRCASCARTARRPAPLPLRVRRRPLQPDRQAAERLHPHLPRRGVHRQGLPHLGRDADRRGRRSPSAAWPRPRPRRSARSPP